jgi:hypothetical protein
MPCILARLRCARCNADKGPCLLPFLAGGMALMGRDGPNIGREQTPDLSAVYCVALWTGVACTSNGRDIGPVN